MTPGERCATSVGPKGRRARHDGADRPARRSTAGRDVCRPRSANSVDSEGPRLLRTREDVRRTAVLGLRRGAARPYALSRLLLVARFPVGARWSPYVYGVGRESIRHTVSAVIDPTRAERHGTTVWTSAGPSCASARGGEPSRSPRATSGRDLGRPARPVRTADRAIGPCSLLFTDVNLRQSGKVWHRGMCDTVSLVPDVPKSPVRDVRDRSFPSRSTRQPGPVDVLAPVLAQEWARNRGCDAGDCRSIPSRPGLPGRHSAGAGISAFENGRRIRL